MLRELLVSASRSKKLEHLVSTSPLSRGVVNRFVAGTTTADVIATVQSLHDVGLLASVDRLGEDTLDRAAAETTVSDYKDVLGALSSAGLTGSSEVSVKLSAVGQALGTDGEAIALDNALSICAAAKAVGTTVTFDMEDHTTIDSTLRILSAIRNEFPMAGGVLQAQLIRTEADVAAFSYQDSRIRLCKGAYAEASDVAYVERIEIDKAFVRSMRTLLESSAYPMLATHDPRLIQIGQALALSSGRDKSTFEFQMLLGVRPQEQLRLAELGHKVRVYVPYGQQWYPYLMRRMAEKPTNLALFLRSLISKD
ncbi:MAG: proline dehydrogenase family protein [Candidatus Nanopelagicales bacterium]|jgi:proline dehydrogenase|nr:proline dehydrogenase family protein [Candidatus Nanopelagicales bacterium]